MQWSTVEFRRVQLTTVQFGTVEYSRVEKRRVMWREIDDNGLQWSTVSTVEFSGVQ